MATIEKKNINLTVNPENYENFKRLASSLGLSASALMDLLMYFVCKYHDKFEKLFQANEDVFVEVLTDLRSKFRIEK